MLQLRVAKHIEYYQYVQYYNDIFGKLRRPLNYSSLKRKNVNHEEKKATKM